MQNNEIIDLSQLFNFTGANIEIPIYFTDFRRSLSPQLALKVKKFKNLVINHCFDEIIDLIDFKKDKKFHFDYLQISLEENNFEIFRFLIANGISVNTENYNGETILYTLSKTESLNKIKKVISAGASINLDLTFYHPIIATLIPKKINEPVFRYYISKKVNLDVTDKHNETILIKLVRKQNHNLIYYFCDKYIRYNGIEKFKLYLKIENNSLHSAIDIAALCDDFYIVKYLITIGSQNNYFDSLIESKNGFHKVINLSNQSVKSSNWIAIVEKEMNFSMFVNKIMRKSCSEWCNSTPLKVFRELYNLPYRKTTIVKWINYACIQRFSHDIDTIKYLCAKEIRETTTKKIQERFRKRPPRSKQVNSVLKIQKKFRKYLYREQLSEKCSICSIVLNNSTCYKLPCKHIFHAFCINRWRRESNTCPYCREVIGGYCVHL